MTAAALRVSVANRQRIVKITARRVCSAALAAARYAGGPSGTLSVVIVGDRKMRGLNREFAGVDDTTDVLAFDLSDDYGPIGEDLAGEVIVNASAAREQAGARGGEPLDELVLYIVHGVLHLGGFRDGTQRQRARMRAAERSVMRRLAGESRG